MPSSSILAFATLAALLIVTPGADTALLLRNAVAGGRRAAVATVLGSRLGLVVHALLAAAGLSALLATSAQAYQVLKMAGGGYLVWLGLRSLARSLRNDTPPAARATGTGNPWLEGFVTNVLNPKTAIFYLAVLPQFIEPGHHAASKALLLASLHIAMSLIWYLGLAVMLDRARRLLGGRVQRAIAAVSGGLVAALGLRLALKHT